MYIFFRSGQAVLTGGAFGSLVRAPFVALLIAINTVLHTTPLLLVAALKWLLPLGSIRSAAARTLVVLAESWIAFNSGLVRWFTPTRLHVDGTDGLDPGGHYLVLANHQSWVDITMMQAVLNRRIPLLRFFIKSELIWVPLLGLAWWALDFPFMKRYSRKQLARRPDLAGKDIVATRRACEKFMGMPVSIMNFVEGTRFTAQKHARQASPYRHLLKPKAGGVAFVLDAMGEALHSIIDVTIVYPGGRPSMLDLIAGRIPEVRVSIARRPIPVELLQHDYAESAASRVLFQRWVNGLWSEKDVLMSRMLAAGPAAGVALDSPAPG